MAGMFDDLIPAQSANKGGGMFDDLIPAPKPPGILDAHIPPNPIFNAPGTIRELPRTADDVMRLAADSMTRGFLDKGLGEEDQAKTQASRERLGWSALPVDVGASVIASPYKVAGMGAGAAWGGLEGAASAYGHQDNWIPSLSDAGDILYEGGKGALLGAGGAKLGEKIGEWWGGKQAAKDQPYKTDAERFEAASDASALQDPISARTVDLESRAERLRAVRDAQQSGGRDEFAKILAGMTSDEAAKATKIATGKSLTTRAGDVADMVGKEVSIPLLITEAVAGGGIPWGTLTAMATKAGISKAGKSGWATRAPAKAVEDLAATVRDPRGIGLTPDQATIDKWRDAFAKAGSGYGRAP